ncbi:MAG: hypothetical protein QF672_01065, partial [SAR202 cluster bacterium]|nr:hypothetical protein [SAR202 cluster bacterium]
MVIHTRSRSDSQYFLEEIGVKWYLDYNHDMSQVPATASKVPFVTMPINAAVWTSGPAQSIGTTITDEDQIVALGFPDPRTIRTTAFNNPGSYWYMFG